MNHSQFVDDTLLLGGASVVIASIFKQMMESFLDASNGAINNRKCQIMVWNSRPRVMQSISRIFQIPLIDKWTSFRYLGIHEERLHVIAKINLKFIKWGTQWLNLVEWSSLSKQSSRHYLYINALPCWPLTIL